MSKESARKESSERAARRSEGRSARTERHARREWYGSHERSAGWGPFGNRSESELFNYIDVDWAHHDELHHDFTNADDQEPVTGEQPVLVRLESDIRALRETVNALNQRLQTVESSLLEPTDEDLRQTITFKGDPYFDWVEGHLDEIRKYPNQFLAIDIKAGKIIVAEEKESAFIDRLMKLPEHMRSELLRIHSSIAA